MSLRLIASLAILLLLIFLPFLGWTFARPTLLAVLVVDKTVATPIYREHRGLMWALNHLKVQPRGQEPPFRYDQDYVGFVPREDHQVAIRPIPERPATYDMVYFADTYGVYTADYYGDNVHGDHSKLIYGGLEPEDISKTVADLKPHGTFVGEFNMFASPTRAPGRAAATKLLGLQWNGWVGRYFEDLTRDLEVPNWLVQDYEQQKRLKYAFRGPGFAYFNDDGRVEVLRIPEEVGPNGLSIHFQDAGHFNVLDDSRYDYWYDVIKPDKGTEVLANYHLDATAQGRAMLLKAGIPVDNPAVTRRVDAQRTSYYFAGDYADYQDVPDRWRLWGMAAVGGWFTPNTPAHPEAFFWRVYLPLMGTICRETAQNLALPVGSNPH